MGTMTLISWLLVPTSVLSTLMKGTWVHLSWFYLITELVGWLLIGPAVVSIDLDDILLFNWSESLSRQKVRNWKLATLIL